MTPERQAAWERWRASDLRLDQPQAVLEALLSAWEREQRIVAAVRAYVTAPLESPARTDAFLLLVQAVDRA